MLKNLIFALLFAAALGCTRQNVEPETTLNDLITQYDLKEVAANDSSITLSVAELKKLLQTKPSPRQLPSGGRIIEGANHQDVDISVLNPDYAVIVHVDVNYWFCTERNNFLAVTGIHSRLKTPRKGFGWITYKPGGVPEKAAYVTDSTVTVSITGVLTYQLKVEERFFTWQSLVGLGVGLDNKSFTSPPTGERCDWFPVQLPIEED